MAAPVRHRNDSNSLVPGSAVASDCLVVDGRASSPEERQLVAEEPLTVRIKGSRAATLMATPGYEEDLALGYALTTGILRSPADLDSLVFHADERLVDLERAAGRFSSPPEWQELRDGTSLIEDFVANFTMTGEPPVAVSSAEIFTAMEAMRRRQALFQRTGGSHAAALARLPIRSATDLIVREDMGRHNALDKVVGAAARAGILGPGLLLLLSGRQSFEMISKAARAGIRRVAGVSAPSALAVALAQRLNLFLAGFVRDRTMTVYSGEEVLLRPASRRGED
jgi:FdhD protein